MRISALLSIAAFVAIPSSAEPAEPTLRHQAEAALHKAVAWFARDVAMEGGYVWLYTEDLSAREGEGKATRTTVWVQPPGTPAVGMALLDAYLATRQPDCLEAALAAGHCLVRGQLQSGGWDYRIEFDPKAREKYAYRVDGGLRNEKARNTSTLDDDTTQAALRFLMRLDQATEFKDAKVHEAVAYGLNSLLAVQYPNGAWPQRFQQPPDPTRHPVKKAGYPASWSRTWPKVDYAGYYTFNDHTIDDTIEIMLEAGRIYGDRRYRQAAEKCGGFILLAQMPEPQPAWAQQYDAQMHPAWARKFEPPSVTGGESQRVLQTLLMLFRETADKRYLEPIPRAIAYLRRSFLSDGRLARFYELETNRALYFTRTYDLTYRDDDMPTHYSFKVGQNLDGIEREYVRLANLDPSELPEERGERRPKLAKADIDRVQRVIAAIDDRGRWLESGRLESLGKDAPIGRVMASETFIRNLRVLSTYLGATNPGR